MSRLLLSLGHNASAILVTDGHVIAGYEEERLSKVKSDSSFPRRAIEQLKKLHEHKFNNITDVYISHWFPDGKLPDIHDRYFDPLYFHFNMPDVKVHSVSMEFTHHDAHAWSAIAFIGPTFPTADTLILVADGFGNFGETMSLYHLSNSGEPEIFKRSFGYESSLGLMYQYATAFLDLKENKDEYKLLGYEANISEYLLDEEVEELNKLAEKNAKVHLEIINRTDPEDGRYDPILAVDALPALRVQYGIHFQKILDAMEINDAYSQEAIRTVIAYYVQTRLEITMRSILSQYRPDNLILVGGLFMNVKLNNTLSKLVDGISIMPLCGDQGAAIGLYHAMERNFIWPDHLFWGTRDYYSILAPRLYMFMSEDIDEAKQYISELIAQDQIVNVIYGAMEFGARALGHTSTLAKPSKDNVDYINVLNGRSTIMPMAPIITRRAANRIFSDTIKVHQSLEYMVCTRDYRTMYPEYLGAAHTLPIYDFSLTTDYTGRPQIIDEQHFLYDVLCKVDNELLLNTSFNEHGMPICYSMDDILRCHEFQISNDIQSRVNTVIIT